MSWVKLDDRFWMHPSLLAAGNTSAGIFARFLSYCGCYLTDGAVPAGVVQTIVGKDRQALDALCSTGLVVRLHGEEAGGVYVPDFLDYNKSKEELEADRNAKRQAGSRGGRSRARANL